MKRKKKFRVNGAVSGIKYLGCVEGESLEQVQDAVETCDGTYPEIDEASSIYLCHQCSGEVEDPEISEYIVEEDKDELSSLTEDVLEGLREILDARHDKKDLPKVAKLLDEFRGLNLKAYNAARRKSK